MKAAIVLLLFSAAFSIVSCQKDPPAIESRKSLLTDKPWIVIKAEEKDNNDPWVDVFPYWAPCDQDNTWIFKPDMSLEYNEAKVACSPNSPYHVLDVVTWAFNSDESELIVEDLTYKIEQLDLNTLVVSVTETMGAVTAYRRITFKH